MHSKWIFNQIESLKIKKKINLLDFASGNGRNSIPLSKKNILVTGGSGFIGSAIVKYLVKKQYNVVVFDNNSRGRSRRI